MGERLARVLVPGIVEELRGAGEGCAALSERLRRDAGAVLADELAFVGLERGQEEARRAGFVLGVVGEALGLATLLGRREEQGVAWTLELVARVLARRGIALVVADGGDGASHVVARIAASADAGTAEGEGWELALLLAAWLVTAAEDLGVGETLVLRAGDAGAERWLELDHGPGAERARELGLLVASLGLGTVRVGAGGRRLELAAAATAGGGSR